MDVVWGGAPEAIAVTPAGTSGQEGAPKLDGGGGGTPRFSTNRRSNINLIRCHTQHKQLQPTLLTITSLHRLRQNFNHLVFKLNMYYIGLF
eukprot:1627548-Amphidinium_carterae.3